MNSSKPSDSCEPQKNVATGLVSERTGILSRIVPLVSGLYPTAMFAQSAQTSPLGPLLGAEAQPYSVRGVGLGMTVDEAHSAAVGEAVERYGSIVGARGAYVEWGTFREFEGDAVHGEAFALPSANERVAPYVPFDEKTPRGWVVGKNIGRDKDVLVPAQLVLPSTYQPRFDREMLAPWTSNGLAAHLDESTAILTGLREVEERDAFMIRYLSRWRPPEVSVRGTCDDVDGLLDSAPSHSAMTVRSWDFTVDLGQPVAVVAVLPHDGRLPPLSVTAACGRDFRGALRKAMLDGYHKIAGLAALGYPGAARRRRCLYGSSGPEDHLSYTCRPGYLDALSWLLDEPAEPESNGHGRSPADASLPAAVAAAARRGLDVVRINLTPTDVGDLGWHVCRVVLPGAQPLVFGSMRCLNSRRLRDVPVEGGLRAEPMPEAEANDVPHPFS